MGPTTQSTLLLRLHDRSDAEAWTAFVLLYRPVVKAFALRRAGGRDADAEDITQEVLAGVAKSLETFDRSRGRFRTWLFALTRNACINAYRGRRRVAEHGVEFPEELADPAASRLEEEWELEYRRALFLRAFDIVRQTRGFAEETLLAFWLLDVNGESAESVAEKLGKDRGALSLAKHRVREALKETVRKLEEDFEDD